MRVSELQHEMHGRLDDVNRRFEDVNHRFDDVDRRFDELRQEMDRRFDDMKQQAATTAVETRRHLDVVAEQLRSDIAVFATVATATSEELIRIRSENEGKAEVLLSALSDHELRLRVLERGTA